MGNDRQTSNPDMIFDEVEDSEVEKVLLQHMDMPYFRNNPSYIALWQRHYYTTKDPKILFLMRHKKISRYYHWIYIELSRFFMSRNHPCMCRIVLDMGVMCGAYDSKVLEEELKSAPAVENTYSEHKINMLLNPKGFFVLGRIWNSYYEVLFYDREMFMVEGEEISFEEYRAMLYRNTEEDSNVHPEETREGPSDTGLKGPSSASCNEDVQGEGKHTLDVDDKLLIDGSLFQVREVIGNGKYRAICMSEEEHTISIKDFLLCKASVSDLHAIYDIDSRFIPPMSIHTLRTGSFVLCEYYKLGSLKRCLDVLDSVDTGIILYFISQLIEVLDLMNSRNYTFSSFSLDSACVTENCELRIVDFDWKHHEIENNCHEDVFVAFDKYIDASAASRDVARVKNELKKIDLEQVIRRFKMHLYEKLYG